MVNVAGFVGVPYEADRKFCRVLVARVLAAHGIPLGEIDAPEDAADWERVDRPQPCDVVVFNVYGAAAHVGVCLGGGRFLHVEKSKRSRITTLTDPQWAARIEGFYRYQGPRT